MSSPGFDGRRGQHELAAVPKTLKEITYLSFFPPFLQVPISSLLPSDPPSLCLVFYSNQFRCRRFPLSPPLVFEASHFLRSVGKAPLLRSPSFSGRCQHLPADSITAVTAKELSPNIREIGLWNIFHQFSDAEDLFNVHIRHEL